MSNKPLILTNFKNYPSAIGKKAEDLIVAHIEAKNQTQGNFAVAVNSLDLFSLNNKYADQINIYAQHIDNATFGSSTGKILPEYLSQSGVKYTIINHSENRYDDFNELKNAILLAKQNAITVVACAETADEGQKISQETQADFIAVEPPELIGGDISVSTARPELISESVEKIGVGKVLVGAGVKTGEDVKVAVEKGAVGVLLASGVTKSSDPKKVLLDLVSLI